MKFKVGDYVKCVIGDEVLYTGTVVSLNAKPMKGDSLHMERISVKVDKVYRDDFYYEDEILEPIVGVLKIMTKLDKALK